MTFQKGYTPWNKGMKGLFSGENHPNYGKHHTEETRRKLSESGKGKHSGINSPMFGKHHTEEQKKKISESLKGIKRLPFSEEHRRKIGESHKRLGLRGDKSSRYGKKHTEESINKMSLAHKGHPSWNKGKHLSEEHKRKISENHSDLSGKKNGFYGKTHKKEAREKLSKLHTGKKLSLETKRKISESRRGEKCNFWKGGIYSIKNRIRDSYRYNDWRQKVFIRDDFTCQDCGQVGGNLNAHHHVKGKSFKDLIEEVKINLPLMDLYEGAMIYEPMWNQDLGTTLCLKCHKKTDNYLKNRKEN